MVASIAPAYHYGFRAVTEVLMRNPVLALTIGFGLAAVALFLIAFPFGIGEPRHGELTRMSSATPGLFLFIPSLFLIIRTWLLIRHRAALLRGEGAIARWQIGAWEWESWREHDAQRSGLFSTLRNKLRPGHGQAPMDGVPVAVGSRAVVLGPAITPLRGPLYWLFSFWSLADVSPAPGNPGSLEFSRFLRGKSARIEMVRVPLGSAGRTHQEAVLQHFATSISEEDRAWARKSFASHFQALAGDVVGARDTQFYDRLFNTGLLAAIFGGIGLFNWYIMTNAERPPLAPNIIYILGIASSVMAASGLALLLGASLGRARQ